MSMTNKMAVRSRAGRAAHNAFLFVWCNNNKAADGSGTKRSFALLWHLHAKWFAYPSFHLCGLFISLCSWHVVTAAAVAGVDPGSKSKEGTSRCCSLYFKFVLLSLMNLMIPAVPVTPVPAYHKGRRNATDSYLRQSSPQGRVTVY